MEKNSNKTQTKITCFFHFFWEFLFYKKWNPKCAQTQHTHKKWYLLHQSQPPVLKKIRLLHQCKPLLHQQKQTVPHHRAYTGAVCAVTACHCTSIVVTEPMCSVTAPVWDECLCFVSDFLAGRGGTLIWKKRVVLSRLGLSFIWVGLSSVWVLFEFFPFRVPPSIY